MQFFSTKGHDHCSVEEAILQGLAMDGGLYRPESFPTFQVQDFQKIHSLPEFAMALLQPFFKGSAIDINLETMQKIFDFPMPLHAIGTHHYFLELFHGPTLSFKDFGARFFAYCLEALAKNTPRTVLVATSGDTGSAAASALHAKHGIRAFILFPYGQITPRQQQQITSFGGNIHALAVRGSFDDCQSWVKSAFSKPKLKEKYALTTANSINIARLLPQMLFYAYTSVHLFAKHHQTVNFIVPSGNLGNVTACYWARQCGFPIGKIGIATNANHVLSDYLLTGQFQAQASIKTLANAMDVGNPSNLARLQALMPEFRYFKQNMDVVSVTDDEIIKAIKTCYERHHYIICPHTATGYHRLQTLPAEEIWVAAATAHPAKFDAIIERALDIKLPVPEALLPKEEHFEVISKESELFNKLG